MHERLMNKLYLNPLGSKGGLKESEQVQVQEDKEWFKTGEGNLYVILI